MNQFLLIHESGFHLIAEMVFMPLEFRDLINFLSLCTHFCRFAKKTEMIHN